MTAQASMSPRIEVDNRKSPSVVFYTLRHGDAHCVIAVDTGNGRVVGLHACSMACAERLLNRTE